MSRENVEIVRRIYDAVARRDAVTAFEAYAEDIVWDLSNAPHRAALATKPVYKGRVGVREFWRDLLASFSEVDLEVEQLLDMEDQVLASGREREVARASGVPVETTHFAVWTLADGKVTRMQVFDLLMPLRRHYSNPEVRQAIDQLWQELPANKGKPTTRPGTPGWS
jgi:ketosteroid isomerase-like protein